MAINSYHGDENSVQASYTMSSSGYDPARNSLTAKSIISSVSASSKFRRRKSKNTNKSSYLSNESFHLRSLAEEKNDKNVMSSFQLAAKLYKSNSDEFKLKKKLGKKNKKSVLTLPNEPSMLPQSYTVSDMNDTEYLKSIQKPKPQKTKKRVTSQKKRHQSPNYGFEYYDRDADYCSQMNVYMDCSSVDVVKNFKGDCRKKAGAYDSQTKDDDDVAPSDVWAVLRNINRFQFHPSPPMSDISTYELTPRKKKAVKKKPNRGVYETCRTEKIAYFSNIEVNIPRPGSPSGSSQITVIDNKICVELEETFDEPVLRKNQPNNYTKPTKKATGKRNRKASLSVTNKNYNKETLIGPTSAITIKEEQTSYKHDDSFEEAPKEICTAVEVQTGKELENKEEANKSRLSPRPRTQDAAVAVTHTGITRGSTPTQNINGRFETKAPLRRSLINRIPWHSTQLHPKRDPAASQNVPSPTPSPTSPPSPIVPPKTLACPGPLKITKIHDTTPMLTQQVTTGPMNRPLSTTTIRRIVSRIKFPLVILGKDQLSGTFEIEEYDYPQFKGLNEHVWPFMVDWMDKPIKSIEQKTTAAKCRGNNHSNFKEKTITSDANPSKFNKKEQKKTNVESKTTGVFKAEPATRFRDNMLKLLYKKSSHQDIANPSPISCIQRDVKVVGPVQAINAHCPLKSTHTNTKNLKTADVTTSSSSLGRNLVAISTKQRSPTPPQPTSPSKILMAPTYRETKPLWGKAKWASDFIENIISKIKNGTYYTREMQYTYQKAPLQSRTSDTDDLKPVKDSKEVSVQVTLPIASEDFTPKITIQKKKELPSIILPGFDDVVPQLEIKSMTRNQITVKHCVTNVVLQFDVNMPPEADRIVVPSKRSTSCIPLSGTESKTKIFKCKTRIINAVLPAELCSIIPKLMMQFMDKEAPLALSIHEDKRNSFLSTISEYTVPEPAKLPLLPQLDMFPELTRLRNGRFTKNPKSLMEKSSSNEKFYIISINQVPYQYGSVEVLHRPQINQLDYFTPQPVHNLAVHLTKPEPTLRSIVPIQNSTAKTNLCTDLVPYSGNKMLFDLPKTQYEPVISFREFFNTMLKENTSSVYQYLPTIQMQTCNNHIYLNLTIGDHRGTRALCIDTKKINIDLPNITTSSSLKAITNSAPSQISRADLVGKQIEYIKHAKTKEFNKEETSKPPSAGISKFRKKSHVRYVKLYKKCKSTSHIAAERSNTLLSKVTNLDEFFQALGSGKLLSSAVDGSCGNKIMSLISDLKSYITGITPRQALLVMLLANKKDTSNLVRFRPVILQGIAVNRITRVSELDMEIEVIEKERFKVADYLGTRPSFQTIHNNDNLLEELMWIARTTASDYQKRFDESSEKLLRALLEKRKGSNPSYLRVMARYVGLGLIKTPGNHQN